MAARRAQPRPSRTCRLRLARRRDRTAQGPTREAQVLKTRRAPGERAATINQPASNAATPTKTVQALNTWDDDHDDAPREPLSREQAQALLRARPGVSAWRVVGLQLAVTLGVALLAGALAGRVAAWSALWGGTVVLLPAALFAGAMRRWLVKLPPAYALFGFAFGELLKISLTVLLLLLAPRVLPAMSWPALLLGLIAVLQVYWIALLLRGKPRSSQEV